MNSSDKMKTVDLIQNDLCFLFVLGALKTHNSLKKGFGPLFAADCQNTTFGTQFGSARVTLWMWSLVLDPFGNFVEVLLA